MRWKPRTLFGAALLAAIVAALAYVAARSEPVPVDLHEVARAPMRITVNAEGRTRIRDVYEVAAPIAGVALRSPVAVGDPVAAGETVVAVIEPGVPALLDARSRVQAEAAVREAEAALHVAESDLRRAEEDRTYAGSQLERARTLADRGSASLTSLEDAAQRMAIAEAAQEAARSRVQMATSALDRARAALIEPDGARDEEGSCCVQLLAPADGVVLEVAAVSERPVAAGASLLSVGDPARLEIVADLLSSDAVRLRPGARAIVERWGGEGALEARLRRVEPAARTRVSALGIEEQRVDAVLDLVSPPEARPGLGHGFAVFLRIVEWEGDDVLQAPLSALFRRGDGWAVFVAEDGVARAREVRVGRRGARSAEIAGGLAPGERIVTHPSEAIGDGTAIVARDGLE